MTSAQTEPAVELVVPEARSVRPSDLVPVERDIRCLPFADDSVDFAAELSRALLKRPEVRTWPELAALGFFLRRAEVVRLRDRFRGQEEDGVVRVPAGLVFHVPPGNVDTIFVYSWLLSLLAGNRNVVRLSGRRSPQVDVLTSTLSALLAEPRHRGVRDRTAIVRYGRNDDVTAFLSSACDIRVLWGGDESVAALRRFPLSPHAQELTFPDRYSYAVVSAQAILDAPARELDRVGRLLADDLYWFDQLACSSPRLLFWLGDEAAAEAAGARLYPAIAAAATARGWGTEASVACQRFTEANRLAADGRIVSGRNVGGALTVVRLTSRDDVDRLARRGGGFLHHLVLGSDLLELARFVRRKDQTLIHYGIDPHALRDLVLQLAGRGLDRLVPIGSALDFASIWDGYDLLDRFVRRVHLRTDAGRDSLRT